MQVLVLTCLGTMLSSSSLFLSLRSLSFRFLSLLFLLLFLTAFTASVSLSDDDDDDEPDEEDDKGPGHWKIKKKNVRDEWTRTKTHGSVEATSELIFEKGRKCRSNTVSKLVGIFLGWRSRFLLGKRRIIIVSSRLLLSTTSNYCININSYIHLPPSKPRRFLVLFGKHLVPGEMKL